MKRISAVGSVVLLLLFASAFALAQREAGREQGRPEGQQHQGQPARAQQPAPSQRPQPPQASRPPQPAKPVAAQPRPESYGGAYHGGVKPNGPTHAGVHQSGVPQTRTQVRGGFVQSRAKAWESERRSWKQRGGYAG